VSSAAPQPSPLPRSWSSPSSELSSDRVLASYRDGVRAFAHLAAKTTDWAVPTPCAGWTLLELTGHALCIARYYHRLLNAALAGEPRRDLPRGPALAELNGAELIALGPMPGPERVIAFDAVAGRYGERLADTDWSTTLGYWHGMGPLTVGQHTLLAAREWHVHAWDVARSFGWDYRPDDPDVPLAGSTLRPGGPPPPGGTPGVHDGRPGARDGGAGSFDGGPGLFDGPGSFDGPGAFDGPGVRPPVRIGRSGVFASGSEPSTGPDGGAGGADPWREVLAEAGRRIHR
jgi:uncharacterized protein (TIGR03083 family)